jgi:hypothetical protein
MSLNFNSNQLHNIRNLLKSRFEEQIAKYLTADNSVFQNSNANDMRVTQDLNSFGEIIAHAQCSVDEKKYIFRVYHITIIVKQKIGSHDMKQTDSSIIIVRSVCVLTSASMIVYLFCTRS